MTGSTTPEPPIDNDIFRTLVEQSPTAVALYTGREMRIHIANDAMLRLWGKGPEAVGQVLRDALPELEGQPFHDLLDNVYMSGLPYEATEDRADLVVDGRLQTFYYTFTYKPLKTSVGVVWGILNTATDVTELVLTRQKLRLSEESTRFALYAGELGTWDLDPLNNTITWDERCKELYGFPKDDVTTYDKVLSNIHTDDKGTVDEAVKRALDPDSGANGEYFCEFRTIGASDGKIRWLRCKGKAYFDDNNQVYRFAGTAVDISREILTNSENAKLLALIDNSSVFVALSSLDGYITYVNTFGREMIGLDSIEQARRVNADYVMPGEIDRIIDDHTSSLAATGTWAGRITYRHFKTGEPIPVEARTILVHDPITGEPNGRATIARDLRQELADKHALQESQHLLYNITSASPTSLWMADKDGNITYVNKTWLDWTGQAYDEVLKDGWMNAVVDDDRPQLANSFYNSLERRVPYETNFRLKGKNGKEIWCVAKGNPQYYNDGTFAGYIGSCTDITEETLIGRQLQQTNTELHEQINQFDFVTDFMPVQLWTANLNGDIDYVNRRLTDYLGVDASNPNNRQWNYYVHPDDLQGTLKAWHDALAAGSTFQVEFRMRNADGAYKWHLSRALPFYNDGHIVKWFGTNTDIDQHKQLQRQKDDFLGIASHELKTPVTSIKAYAQVLGAMLTKDGEHNKAAMVNRMDNQINRLTNLIGDLLDVTKINSGKLQFNKTWFSLNTLVREVMDDLQHTTVKHTLVHDFADTGKIFSDRERISQVLVNLISNAIKYSPAEGEVIIRTHRQNNTVTVSVEDFGIGIVPDKHKRVFEQFYRVSGSKQHTFPGLGLGLYISSEIIKREGGKMWVNSVEGEGSTFHFSLPVEPVNNDFI
ncbi:PAS domain-containing protein [Mucilaginibacter roseus]|uniref:histidine kinase n=1 Tax=Mucilaginibacter roseus TaxID=1528868 RepID=A0ABS8U367_9SPHI|nr:PAS domain-containing protein [Mucilaginibacter roseus]MCD8740324.1 PAS domain-containing protein [Mucilaginibacter roseus]